MCPDSISQHRYSAAFCSGGDFALSSFLSKANVRSNLTLWKPDIAASKQHGLRYVLGYLSTYYFTESQQRLTRTLERPEALLVMVLRVSAILLEQPYGSATMHCKLLH